MVKRFFKKALFFLLAFPLFFFCTQLFLVKPAYAVSWYSSSWHYRRAITVDNTGNSDTLTNYQVKVTLTSSNFDFSKAQSSGQDIRFTDDDATTLLNHWVESYSSSSQTATIWVKVPSITALSSKTIYLYYGYSSASSVGSGDNTFEFFDDFESPISDSGFYSLGSASTVMEQTAGWETSAPHSLSIVEVNSGGFTYWGYYGLTSGDGACGLARSNDLITWTKYDSNPLITNCRWLNVIKVGDTFYGVYTKNFGTTPPYIVLTSSPDGITFTDIETIVAAEAGLYNQNPFLYQNPNDNKYYLYWYYGNGSTNFNIMVRSASAITDLDSASSTTILTSYAVLAAPNIIYYDGTYFLAAEILQGSDSSVYGYWQVKMFASTSPTSGFVELNDSPVSLDDDACPRQHIFGSTLYTYFCHRDHATSTWTLTLKTANLSSGRASFSTVDSAKWTKSGGAWQVISATQPDGSTGYVAKGVSNFRDGILSSYSGTNYIAEVNGKQIYGGTYGWLWQLGVRATDIDHYYGNPLFFYASATDYVYAAKYNGSRNPTYPTWTTTQGLATNTWNKVMIKANSSSFEYFLDGSQTLSFSDSTHSSGKIVLQAERQLLQAYTAVYFDNAFVRQYTSSEPSTSAGSEGYEPTAPSGSVSINSGSSYTTSTSVTLTISATDSFDSASSIQMQVANDSDFSGASWETYTISKSWTLSSGDGTKTVYVKFKDSDGNISSSYSDGIIYDATPPSLTNFNLDVPADNSFTNKDKPAFRWHKATDATSGLSKYQVSVDPEDGVEYILIDDINPDPLYYRNYREDDDKYIYYDGDFLQVYTKRADKKLADKKYTWEVKAIDRAGNYRITEPWTLHIDSAPPTVVLTSVGYRDNLNYKADSSATVFTTPDLTPTFKGKADAGSTVKISLVSNGVYCQTTSAADSSWECTPFEIVPYGTHSVSVKATDRAENSSTLPTFSLIVAPISLKTKLIEKEVIPDEEKITEEVGEITEEKEQVTEEQVAVAYKVTVKVVDLNKKPINGAKATLFSIPQEAITDENGLAIFENVEKGNHKIVIAYKGLVGEQEVNLEGEVKEFFFTIQIKQTSPLASPVVISIIGLLILIIIGLIVCIYRRRRKDQM